MALKKIAIMRIVARETGVSRHRGGPIESPPKIPVHHITQLVPDYAERRQCKFFMSETFILEQIRAMASLQNLLRKNYIRCNFFCNFFPL